MTSETKIAMLAGTGIMIFIGILVSDYLAEKRSPTSSHPNEGLRVASQKTRGGAAGATPTAAGPDKPIPAPERAKQNDRNAGDPPAPDGGNQEGEGSSPQGSQPSRPEPLVGDGTQLERVHMVQEGQTLRAIARKYYGDRSKWKKILEANADKVSEPTALRAGLQLTIPPARSGGGSDPGNSDAGGANGDETDDSGEQESPEDGNKVHVVQQGETLRGIAKRYYGDPGYWRTLREANRDKVAGPRSLKPEMRLTIPDKRGQARDSG